ncbi:MAG: methyltransferase domain-containing protein [Nitrospirae bacterium]|nr:methyltransferase domain-containing protein [Nitrospirota bacterium]
MPPHPEPAQLLIEYLPLLSKGRALDVAMGRGRNALFLASHGFDVVGLENDEESINICRADASTRGLNLEIRCTDLEDTATYKIEESEYDVVICFLYLQRNLIPDMKEALKPGGIMIYETFLIDQHLTTGHPRRREFCFEHNELLNNFQGFRILYYREGKDANGTYKASLVAQKSK